MLTPLIETYLQFGVYQNAGTVAISATNPPNAQQCSTHSPPKSLPSSTHQYASALAAQGPSNEQEDEPAQSPPKENEIPRAASPAQSHSGLTEFMEDMGRRIG
ncbi:hypothetical protein OCU04_000202 [Sclerotinia nivalis]|uniref:Uncharacterized protein n=1 Tax=Sclerotinia nivalis TaxID=352851 RepID=A0A9X0AVM2_9HELO|nr:hypothetical protein OCU04_000202 [Sclerotinia nivalis]